MAEIHQIATVPVTAHAFNADRSREFPLPLPAHQFPPH